jgi:hypothetical protein
MAADLDTGAVPGIVQGVKKRLQEGNASSTKAEETAVRLVSRRGGMDPGAFCGRTMTIKEARWNYSI